MTTFVIFRNWLCFAICLLLVSFPSGLHAQALSGITGTVADASGAVVPNAKVTVTNQATQVASHAVTSSAGTYTPTDFIPGPYTLQVELHRLQTSLHNAVGGEVP